MKPIIFATSLLLCLPTIASAATVLYFGFTTDTTPEVVPEVTATNFYAGSQITQVELTAEGVPRGGWRGDNWEVTRYPHEALETKKYAAFQMTVNADQALTITQMTFDVDPDGAGPKDYLLTVTDIATGLTTVIGEESILELTPNQTQDPTLLTSIKGQQSWETIVADPDTLVGLTGTFEFRIYGYGAQRIDRSLVIDNVTISGTLNRVPEPSITITLSMAGLVLGLRRR